MGPGLPTVSAPSNVQAENFRLASMGLQHVHWCRVTSYSAGPKSCYPPSINVTFSELCSVNYVKDKNLFFFAINYIFPK